MSKFLSSLGISQTELRLLEAIPPPSVPHSESEQQEDSTPTETMAEAAVSMLVNTGEFHQGIWRLSSGEAIGFELVSWETQHPVPGGDLCRLPKEDVALKPSTDEDPDDTSEEADVSSPLISRLPVECLARVAADLSLADLAAVCTVSAVFRRLVRGDVCWVERLRRHFGPSHLRASYPQTAGRDPCCRNPFARIFMHALFGLYRARPEGDPSASATEQTSQQQQQQPAELPLHQRIVPDASIVGALFQRPVLSPVFLGIPLLMDFRLQGVHPGRYDILLRTKKLLCDPLDSESVATAAGSSGVRVPLLQARINRRSVTISNFECAIEVTADPKGPEQLEPTMILKDETVSHLLQNYSMPSDRWFYWRLAGLDLHSETSARDLKFRVSVLRRGVADTTVTQEEFERELRNALLIDHLFLRLRHCQQLT